jgi:hypothetical protein
MFNPKRIFGQFYIVKSPYENKVSKLPKFDKKCIFMGVRIGFHLKTCRWFWHTTIVCRRLKMFWRSALVRQKSNTVSLFFGLNPKLWQNGLIVNISKDFFFLQFFIELWHFGFGTKIAI